MAKKRIVKVRDKIHMLLTLKAKNEGLGISEVADDILTKALEEDKKPVGENNKLPISE